MREFSYKYNDHGQIAEELLSISNLDFIFLTTFEWEDLNLSKIKYYYGEDLEIQAEKHFTYDDFNNPFACFLKDIYFDQPELNSQNNVIEMRVIDHIGNWDATNFIFNEYEYNEDKLPITNNTVSSFVFGSMFTSSTFEYE